MAKRVKMNYYVIAMTGLIIFLLLILLFIYRGDTLGPPGYPTVTDSLELEVDTTLPADTTVRGAGGAVTHDSMKRKESRPESSGGTRSVNRSSGTMAAPE